MSDERPRSDDGDGRTDDGPDFSSPGFSSPDFSSPGAIGAGDGTGDGAS